MELAAKRNNPVSSFSNYCSYRRTVKNRWDKHSLPPGFFIFLKTDWLKKTSSLANNNGISWIPRRFAVSGSK